MKVLALHEKETTIKYLKARAFAHAPSLLILHLLFLITLTKHVVSLNSSELLASDSDYVKDETLSLLAPTFSNECKSDSHCVDERFCLNGSCVDTCRNGDSSAHCVYFRCDSKQLITNESRGVVIETNNYPLLVSYFANQKCSWLLKHHDSSQRLNVSGSNASWPLIELSFSRFSTLHASDYLYIFDGDSIYSPMIAALR
jgi:hypothetical protein